MKVVINEYASDRAFGFKRWFPEATICKRYKQETTPESFDLLILSGGPMSADEKSRAKYQFLAEDMTLLQELYGFGERSAFVLGVCLGAQLMTFACGGYVEEGDENLVGWNELVVTHQHPAFNGLIHFLQCEIHQNRIVDLGADGQVLVTSALDPIEAFSIGKRFLGTAYHPEITKDEAEWISNANDGTLRFEILSDTTLSLNDAYVASEKFFQNIRALV